MEFLDLYTLHRCTTGEVIERGMKIPPENFHLVIHVCIFNSRGQMLIQQRQPFKKGWPNMWDITVGGCALAGEISQEAAMREISEELGLDIDLARKRPSLTVNFEVGFDDIYLIKKEVDLEDLSLQSSEVKSVKWATKEEILQLINSGEFIPYHKSLVDLFFVLKDNAGVHVT
jgi:isopentenyldiphosphate isomerase